MGLMPAASPFAHKTSIELQELGKLARTPSGMGMNGQDNACASGHGLRCPVRLDELEEWLDLGRSKLKGMQRKLMTHVIPPSLVGKRSHRTRLSYEGGKSSTLSTTHQFMLSIPESCVSFPAFQAEAGTNLR